MKTLIPLILSTLILWLTCYLSCAPWYLYLIMWPIGLGFGFLFTVAVFWILGVKSKKKSDLKRTWEQ